MPTTRIDLLRRQIAAENLDVMLVNDMNQIRYLTGFSGSAGVLVISRRGADFFTDFRYSDQAGQQVKGAKVTITSGDAMSHVKELPLWDEKNLRVGFDASRMTYSQKVRLEEMLKNVLFVPAEGVVAEMGWVKDSAEIASIKKAVAISDAAFERILPIVKPGIREREVAAELEYQMMMMGAEGPAFGTIVASGYRSAMPHGAASEKKIEKGDFVTFDFGAISDGFISDTTRTVVVGKATSRQKKIYDLVLRAHLAGIKKVKAGVPARAVDDACRQVITKAGYGKNFGHGTGHGIGFFLNPIHMGPRVSQLSKDVLKVSNVVTIEPGIYISGWGGVRIEDDVLVTKNGGKPLNRAEKKLLEL